MLSEKEINKFKTKKFFKVNEFSDDELCNIFKLLNVYKLTPSFQKIILTFKEFKVKHWCSRYRRLFPISTKQTKYVNFLRYGKEEGLFRYKLYTDKVSYNSSREGFTKKLGAEKANEYFKNRKTVFRDSEFQRKNAKKFAAKRKESPELYIGVIPNQVEYWTKQGFSETEAILKVSERQSTFSLEKCIEKYGDIEGTIRWKARQEKWQNTLKSKPQEEIDEINKNKNPCIKFSQEKRDTFFNRLEGIGKNIIFDDSDLFEYLEKESKDIKWGYLTKNEFINSLPYIGNIDIDINKAISMFDFKFPKRNLVRKNSAGFTYLKIKEGLLRSFHEINFYKELKRRNIYFKLDKCYNNSNLKYDFYLPEYEIYIEIAGMMNIKQYRESMEYKKLTFGSHIIEPDNIKAFFERIDNDEFKRVNKSRSNI